MAIVTSFQSDVPSRLRDLWHDIRQYPLTICGIVLMPPGNTASKGDRIIRLTDFDNGIRPCHYLPLVHRYGY